MNDDGLDPAVAELLSASIDGAVAGQEAAAVERAVERSSAARIELDRLRAVKAALGNLPPVDPPAGFFEAMLDRGSPRPARVVPVRRWSLAGMAASALGTAALWLLLAGGGIDAISPPLDVVETAAVGAPGLRQIDPGDAPAPESDRLELVEVLEGDDTRGAVAVLADRAGRRVAVHRSDGDIEWEQLPEGTRGRHGNATTWVDLTTEPGMARVVVAQGGTVYTLVSGDMGSEVLVSVGAGLPAGDGSEGWTGRVRRACEALVDAFSLD